MALIYQCLELKGPDGNPSGRYRMTVRSDEDSAGVINPLCDCPNGHENHDTARRCLQAAVVLDAAFPRIASTKLPN